MNDSTHDDTTQYETAHRAPGLGILGIIALAVAAWGLAGGPTLPDASDLAWIAVGVGVLIGVVLIISGARARG